MDTPFLSFGANWPWGECPEGVDKQHAGIDLSGQAGEYVYAAHSGTVRAKFYDATWKWCLSIENDNHTQTTVYWHVDPLVDQGDWVNEGHRIARIADVDSNTHLHFGVRKAPYSNIANRGALPRDECGGDPAWPEHFVNPAGLQYRSGPEQSPTIAQSPMSGSPGATFVKWGTGFTPEGTATLHVEKPDGSEYPTDTVNLDSEGHFEIDYNVEIGQPTGNYTWWAVDDATGLQSNELTYEITGGDQNACLEGIVYDRNTGNTLFGAEISLGSGNTESDASGQYLFNSLNAGEYILEVTKDGYSSLSKSVYLPTDSTTKENMWLSPILEGIQVTDISCRYPGEVFYLSDVSFKVEYTVNVNWGGHVPEKVIFQTTYNTYEVETSGSTASLELNVGDEFDSCDVLTVQAVSSDGSTSQIVEGPMSVALKPYPVEFPIENDIGDGFRLKTSVGPNLSFIDDGIEKGIIPESIPLFGDKEFKLEWIPEVSFEYESSGRTEITAKSRGAKFDMAGFDLELSGSLGGEGQFLKQECAWDWDGDIGITGKLSVKKSWPFVVTAGPVPIPMYLKASFKTEAEAELGILNIDPIDLNGVFEFEPYVRGSLGAGVDSKLAIEGWLGGGPDFELQWPTEPTLKQLEIYLNGGVTVYAWLWKWPTEALRWDWTYDQQGQSIFFTNTDKRVSQGPKLASREYLQDPGYGNFVGSRPALMKKTEDMLTFPKSSSLQPMQTNIFPRSESYLSASGDQICLTWLFDDPERTAENRTLAITSFWDGSTWSEPLDIEDDGTADFHPRVLSLAEGDVLAAWENEKTEMGYPLRSP